MVLDCFLCATKYTQTHWFCLAFLFSFILFGSSEFVCKIYFTSLASDHFPFNFCAFLVSSASELLKFELRLFIRRRSIAFFPTKFNCISIFLYIVLAAGKIIASPQTFVFTKYYVWNVRYFPLFRLVKRAQKKRRKMSNEISSDWSWSHGRENKSNRAKRKRYRSMKRK